MDLDILEKRPKKNPVELLISKRRKKSYLIVTSHQIQAVIPQIDGSKTVTDSHCFQYQSEYTCVPWNQRAIGMCIQFWWIHCRSTPCQITAKQYEHANIAVKEHAMIVYCVTFYCIYTAQLRTGCSFGVSLTPKGASHTFYAPPNGVGPTYSCDVIH